MIPIVSEKYKYIFFYNPKSACSVARQLFLKLHRDELGAPEIAELDALKAAQQDEWHQLDKLYPLQADKDYTDYFKFTLVRHPATRLVSAYLNRIVLHRTDQQKIADYFVAKYDAQFEVNFSFRQFCEYVTAADEEAVENEHFLPQSYIDGIYKDHLISSPYFNPISMWNALKHRLRKVPLPPRLALNQVCKVENLNADLLSAYTKIFSASESKLAVVTETLKNLPMYNVTFTNDQHLPMAADVGASDLADLKSLPPYSSFLDDQVLQRLESYFAKDLELFDYSLKVDQSIIKFEKQKTDRVSETVPADFDWAQYVALNADLSANGIDTQVKAISHWIHHGRFEDREY